MAEIRAPKLWRLGFLFVFILEIIKYNNDRRLERVLEEGDQRIVKELHTLIKGVSWTELCERKRELQRTSHVAVIIILISYAFFFFFFF